MDRISGDVDVIRMGLESLAVDDAFGSLHSQQSSLQLFHCSAGLHIHLYCGVITMPEKLCVSRWVW
jgi:hypothetical protein